jgi:hypothetical protein
VPDWFDPLPAALDAVPDWFDPLPAALDVVPAALDAVPDALDAVPAALDAVPAALSAVPASFSAALDALSDTFAANGTNLGGRGGGADFSGRGRTARPLRACTLGAMRGPVGRCEDFSGVAIGQT